MTTNGRPSFLLRAGESWLMLPPRIANLLESQTNVAELRVRIRGIDPEASAVLEDLRTAALNWRGFPRSETEDDSSRKPIPHSEVLTSQQASNLANVSRQAVTKAIRSGRLLATRSGRGWEINRQDLEQWRTIRNQTGAA